MPNKTNTTIDEPSFPEALVINPLSKIDALLYLTERFWKQLRRMAVRPQTMARILATMCCFLCCFLLACKQDPAEAKKLAFARFAEGSGSDIEWLREKGTFTTKVYEHDDGWVAIAISWDNEKTTILTKDGKEFAPPSICGRFEWKS